MREKCGRNAGENVEKMREKLPKKSHRKCGESYDKTLQAESDKLSKKFFFLKNSKKWPKFDEKISKIYFSRKRAELCIFKHPEIDSTHSEDSESVESGLQTSEKFNFHVLAYVCWHFFNEHRVHGVILMTNYVSGPKLFTFLRLNVAIGVLSIWSIG